MWHKWLVWKYLLNQTTITFKQIQEISKFLKIRFSVKLWKSIYLNNGNSQISEGKFILCSVLFCIILVLDYGINLKTP